MMRLSKRPSCALERDLQRLAHAIGRTVMTQGLSSSTASSTPCRKLWRNVSRLGTQSMTALRGISRRSDALF